MSGRPKIVLGGNKPGVAKVAPVQVPVSPPPQAVAKPMSEPKAADLPKQVEGPKPAPIQPTQAEPPKAAQVPKPAQAPKPEAVAEPEPLTKKEPAAAVRPERVVEFHRTYGLEDDAGASPALSSPPGKSISDPPKKADRKPRTAPTQEDSRSSDLDPEFFQVPEEPVLKGPQTSQTGSGKSAKTGTATDQKSGSKKEWVGFTAMICGGGAIPALTLYLSGAGNTVVGAVLALQVAIASVYLLVSNKAKGDASSQKKDDGKTGGAAGAAS